MLIAIAGQTAGTKRLCIIGVTKAKNKKIKCF